MLRPRRSPGRSSNFRKREGYRASRIPEGQAGIRAGRALPVQTELFLSCRPYSPKLAPFWCTLKINTHIIYSTQARTLAKGTSMEGCRGSDQGAAERFRARDPQEEEDFRVQDVQGFPVKVRVSYQKLLECWVSSGFGGI